ncbi:hypothetical protein [Haloarcula marina]|uniref:hypothetical protein n=1 Tax=Haloarcula marina TaxID=2961574 RepID=UPI0020B79381|nr:hypothetical protein [Halomicroarcula marina]
MDWRPLAVATLLLLTGCSGFTAGERTPTVTPAPVPEQPTGAAGIPGLTNDSIADPEALALAHRDLLANRSYTLGIQWRGGNRGRVTELAVESERRYRYRSERTTGGYSDRTFVDGPVRYSRARRPLGVQFSRAQSVPAHDRFGHVTGRLLESYLPVGSARINPHPGGYEIVAGRAPAGFYRTEEYAVRAVVTPPGFVRSFAVGYRDAAQNTTVSYRFRYTRVDETTVDRPGWVRDQWPNASVETADATTPSAYDNG